MHRRIPFWAYVVIATTCAVLLPAVAAVGASLEGADALIRVAVAGVIASLAGLAVSASAAATKAADRRAASAGRPSSWPRSTRSSSADRAASRC